jgi:hypothetical protein
VEPPSLGVKMGVVPLGRLRALEADVQANVKMAMLGYSQRPVGQEGH